MVLIAGIVSCSKTETKSPEQFAQVLVKSLKEKDKDLFESLFITESEYDEVASPTPADSWIKADKKIMLQLTGKQISEFDQLVSNLGPITGGGLEDCQPQEFFDTESASSTRIFITAPDGTKKILYMDLMYKCGENWRTVGEFRMRDEY